jgi:cytidine deaminase
MNDTIKKMIAAAQVVCQHAYAPYSNFFVGCCIYSKEGNFFSGCNIENASYSVTQCAEGSAVGNMISAGDKTIREIVLYSDSAEPCFPCGSCRQQLSEFSEKDTLVHICNQQGVIATKTMDELLPACFSKSTMGI